MKGFKIVAAAVLIVIGIGVGITRFAVGTSGTTEAAVSGPALLRQVGCSDKEIQSGGFESICPPLLEGAQQGFYGGTSYTALVFSSPSATLAFLRKYEQPVSATQQYECIFGCTGTSSSPIDEGTGAVYGPDWILEIESPNELSLLKRAVKLTRGRIWKGSAPQ